MAAAASDGSKPKDVNAPPVACPPDAEAAEKAFAGVATTSIDAGDLRISVLQNDIEPAKGSTGILFVHGNLSSKEMYRQSLAILAQNSTYGAAVDLRGYGETIPKDEGGALRPISAGDGLKEWADEVEAAAEGILKLHPNLAGLVYVGWSLGGCVMMRRLLDNAHRASQEAARDSLPDPKDDTKETDLTSTSRPMPTASGPSRVLLGVVLQCPGSPSGYGGSRGTDAFQACHEDGAGSGAGNANPAVVTALQEADRGDGPFTARGLLRALYVADPSRIEGGAGGEREEAFVSSILQTRTGDGFYPGTCVPSEHWPGTAPGEQGILNALAPQHCAPLWGLAGKSAKEGDEEKGEGEGKGEAESTEGPPAVVPPVPVLWVRGGKDKIVADGAALDMAVLGQAGIVPGWPGAEVMPPQAMVSQTRAWLEGYGERSGAATEEVVMEECGHGPCIEDPEGFVKHILRFKDTVGKPPAGAET